MSDLAKLTPFTSLVEPADLAKRLSDPNWAVVDCRFALGDPEWGRQAFREAHIPGAVYAHLNNDLSGPIEPGVTGRHPLPDPDAFARILGQWGIDNETQVVAYDDKGGAIAARLWWMLRWLGHSPVAVLDGGFPRWRAEGYPTRSGSASSAPRTFIPHPRPEMAAGAEEVTRAGVCLIDARDAERYRGEVEPIDPVAGHIPGAINLPFKENLDEAGCFRTPDALRARFDAVVNGVEPEDVICYCGSGVTAAHNILAMTHAGIEGPRLYAGSWSDWITDADRPVATGEG